MCLRSFALRRAPILPYFRTISRWCVVPKISHHRFAASCTDDQYADSTTYSFTLPKRVIVIGGGFGGSKVSKLLEKEHTFQVILITPGSTFDYIPSYPFLLGKNPHAPSLEKIQCPHRSVRFSCPPSLFVLMDLDRLSSSFPKPKSSSKTLRLFTRDTCNWKMGKYCSAYIEITTEYQIFMRILFV